MNILNSSIIRPTHTQSLRLSPPPGLLTPLQTKQSNSSSLDMTQVSAQGTSDTSLSIVNFPPEKIVKFTESFGYILEKPDNSSYLDTDQPDQQMALSEYLKQYNDYLEIHPEIKDRIRQMPKGEDFLHSLDKAQTGTINSDDIKALQRFLTSTISYDLGYRGHGSGIDGWYGVRTHRALQNFLLDLQQSAPNAPLLEQPAAMSSDRKDMIGKWQELARNIIQRRKQGLELHDITAPLYPGLLEQVSATPEIRPEQDPLAIRVHSMRPHIGNRYQLNGSQLLDKQTGLPAQTATVIFDRTHNLLTALDADGEVVMAFEAHNNTRRHFENKSEEWLMEKSIVPETNAPAPNGIYAINKVYASDANGGKTFGPYTISLKGGVIAHRAILIHSRDGFQNREIPWSQDQNTLMSRTLGCFLLQDPDLRFLSKLLKQTDEPIAFVVQGSYQKNLRSPGV